MPLTIETGAGVRGANSYIDTDFVTAYLADRNRDSENNWSTLDAEVTDAACIAATDHIDRYFGPLFAGYRQFRFPGAQAYATIDLTGNPAGGDSFTLDGDVYSFAASASDPVQPAREVVIGTAATATATATQAVIAASQTKVSASVSGNIVVLTFKTPGTAGNGLTLTASGANVAVTGFAGGEDAGDQPLEFPRLQLYLPDGAAVLGVPDKLKWAASEYAVRAAVAALEPDQNVPSPGQGPITEIRERVEGAIDTTTKYADITGRGSQVIITPYPAADKLLEDYLRRGGVSGAVGRA